MEELKNGSKENFNELYNNSWSGAIDVLEQAEKVGAEEEVIEDYTPTDVEVNDYIWFELGDELNLWEHGE